MSLPEGTLKLTDSALERHGSLSVLLPESLSVRLPCPFGPRDLRGLLQNPIHLQSLPVQPASTGDMRLVMAAAQRSLLYL